LETLAEGGGDGWTLAVGQGMEVIKPADIRALIRETLVQTAAHGRVVIVSHAASFALDRRPETLRLFVTASRKVREERVAAAAEAAAAHPRPGAPRGGGRERRRGRGSPSPRRLRVQRRAAAERGAAARRLGAATRQVVACQAATPRASTINTDPTASTEESSEKSEPSSPLAMTKLATRK